MDYYWIDQDEEYKKAPPEYQEKILVLRKELQRLFFIAQIRLAQTYNLPVVIHNRDAGTDTLEILKETNCQKFILHCFSEDLEFAKACIDFAPECMVSFSGIVTFQNAKDIQETAQHIPLKNIIIETDAPYLTPVPYRGKRENESALVAHVFEKICELRSESRDEIEKQIYENSRKIFRL
ncbi:MAG: TatD family hydrolase [Candidatus Peribacteria bacterium]|nr:MAG: TatD family hydrolase [Candidatus Peribacteria bacterium]